MKRRRLIGFERIDSISSIGEERDHFKERLDDSEGEGVTVFKKILQEYQIYNDKKIKKNMLKKRK